MWEWLQGLSGGAAAFVGSLTGSGLGLLAILGGALFNARLNRLRDDRLRADEARGIAAALCAELSGIRRTLNVNAGKELEEGGAFLASDLAHQAQVMPEVVSKIGLLGRATLIQEVIDAYVTVDQYYETLLLLGGKAANQHPTRRAVYIPPDSAKAVQSLNKNMAEDLDKVIANLEAFLKR